MFGNAKARLAAVVRSLTRAGGEQPLHKVALAVVLLLDVFTLVSIFDGLHRHTRQLASPWERVPPLCRQLVIERAWSPEARLERLAGAVAQRRSPYAVPEEPGPAPVPACARVLSPLDAVAEDEGLGGLLETRHRLASQLGESDSALAREKAAYDTHLLEALAQPTADRPRVEAIAAAVQARTATIKAARARLAELDARLRAAPQVTALFAALDALGPGDSAALAAELRELERWHAVKRLAMQLVFLLPLLAAFAAWHAVSERRGRGLQALVSAHLAVVASVPLVFHLAEAVYEVVPKHLLKRLIDLLVSLKLVALWHYLVIAVAVAAALATAFAIQRWLFSRERLLERRIAKGQCQRCGKRVPGGARACPFCGYAQRRPCASCGGETPVHAPFCTECGKAAGPAEPGTEIGFS